ncbi:putative non-ribosomal peptide synthetase [Methylophaga frappieri]|uniref:Putative non-ribosomal peptide synthetase n=1 Tax=Methylophaga frappieri (strain ATCC BAA-2434 / DSM 25690 / JAM7) TaxID=754477 RepID=I1YF68_METFJ|nr:non-ribosomal peptide synthetase [Methylophaga frappieri]AFJ01561.1 putative non-ribosomal peptide synthetase [Methylophaga frappieri]
MSIATIVSDFEALGVYLWAEHDQLKFKAPAGVLSDAHKEKLKHHKDELIAFLADPVIDGIQPDLENRYSPFPLTDLQLAYLVGRTNAIEYGGVGCHSYIELDMVAVDLEKLQTAWHKLISRHEMLRARITQNGYQQILRDVSSPPVIHHDFRQQPAETIENKMLALRERLAHRCYQPDQWPQYEMHLSSYDEGAVLHFSIDLLIADFASIQILLAELGELYNHPQRDLPKLSISYRDVVLARKAIQDNPKALTRYEKHKAYWLKRLETMPMPPELPMARQSRRTSEIQQATVTFNRLHFELPADQWQSLSQQATTKKITPSSVVLTAFTETLSRWSRHQEFCLNLTMLNRSTAHPDIRGLVGDFIEVNVLGVTPNPEHSFAERAVSIQQRLWQDLEHTDFSGIEVLREMSRQQGSNVIVPIVYTSTVGLSGDQLDANEFMHNAKLRYGITQTPQVWLDCQVTERNEQLLVDWDIRSDIFKSGVIEQAHGVFCKLLQDLASDAAIWQSTQPISLPEAMQHIREETNNTDGRLPAEFLHTGFCRQALTRPDAVAVISGDRQITYHDLARQALTLRSFMTDHVNTGDRVAIVMDKGEDQIAAVLAVLLANATYVPIEGAQPVARRNTILSDANIQVVLTDNSRLDSNWPANTTVIIVDKIDALPDSETTRQILNNTLVDHQDTFRKNTNRIGYIIYTSGTTGRPKGVMMSHRAALNTVADINDRFNISEIDNVLGLVSFAFDLSIWDIFGTLGAGATLVLPDADKRADPAHWAQVMSSHAVTVWNSVPAQLQMLTTQLEWQSDANLNPLRLAMLSGDWIPISLPDAARKHLPQLQVVSLGGPTETAIWCVSHLIGEVPDNAYSIPYGKPLTNHQIHILNTRLEPCPDWVTGEMYIGGAGLAAGYAGDSEQTKARFIYHPDTGQCLYRSGDLGRYRPDGIIEIQGRDDGQVKIHGQRIELGEVEAVICSHEGVRSAAVVCIGSPALLAAAVVPDETSPLQNSSLVNELNHFLTERLPGYMIPANLMIMPSLPLSSNGKLDRKTLQKTLSENKNHQADFEAPLETPLEQNVARIWRELLNIETLSRHDDFFSIGGSSLTAINLLSAFLAEGYPADIDLIFNNPTFSAMVFALEQSNAAKTEWLDSIDLSKMASHAMAGLKDAQPYEATSSIKTILLTGASGYLGSYLLNRLLRDTDYHLYCLLRCDDPEHGIERLIHSAAEKGLNIELNTSRLTILPGELSEPKFGLSDTAYQHLAENVDVVIHNASIINLMDPLSGLYPTNVEGVSHILSLASTTKIKPIHYISTIGVHHALPEDTAQPVLEHTPVMHWRPVTLTYEQSKIMAETLFGYAREHGMPVNILRPGTITWDTGEKPFINDDAFLKFYRACLAIKSYPASSLAVNIVPVDYVADCIVAITLSKTGKSENFHLVSEQSTPVETVYQWCNELGCSIMANSFKDWKNALDDNFILGFVNLYFGDDMDNGGHHQYSTENLQQVTASHGIESFSVTKGYLKSLTDQFHNADA